MGQPSTGGIDSAARSEGLRLLSAWLGRTQIRFTRNEYGIMAELPADEGRQRPPIALRFGPAPSKQPGLYFAATSASRIPREQWAHALALCNDWNTRVLMPRARLCATDWNAAPDASLTLEAFLVLVPGLPLTAVASTGTQLVRAALQFWTPPAEADVSQDDSGKELNGS